MVSKRDVLLGAATLPREVVSVPELDASFTVQGMSGKQRDAFESSLFTTTQNGRKRIFKPENIRAKLLVYSVVNDETGDLLFTENDIEELGRLPARILDRLFSVAQRLSGLRDEDIEELAKN